MRAHRYMCTHTLTHTHTHTHTHIATTITTITQAAAAKSHTSAEDASDFPDIFDDDVPDDEEVGCQGARLP